MNRARLRKASATAVLGLLLVATVATVNPVSADDATATDANLAVEVSSPIAYVSMIEVTMDDGADPPSALLTAIEEQDALAAATYPALVDYMNAQNRVDDSLDPALGAVNQPPLPDHDPPTLKCSHGTYSFSDSDGTETIRYNCPFSNVNWGFTLSPNLQAIASGPVSELGARWWRNYSQQPSNSPHVEPAYY